MPEYRTEREMLAWQVRPRRLPPGHCKEEVEEVGSQTVSENKEPGSILFSSENELYRWGKKILISPSPEGGNLRSRYMNSWQAALTNHGYQDPDPPIQVFWWTPKGSHGPCYSHLGWARKSEKQTSNDILCLLWPSIAYYSKSFSGLTI